MATTKRKASPPSTSNTSNRRIWVYLTLLTLQYGAQPLISKRFIRPEVIVTSSVLTCELAKVICAIILLAKEGSLMRLSKEWSLTGSLTASCLPAAIYALQNSLLQISYKNLDSLTFSMLNQTKLFFTAFFTYLILRYVFAMEVQLIRWFGSSNMRYLFSDRAKLSPHHILHDNSETTPQKQSVQQMGALVLLIIAAVLLSIGEGSSKSTDGSNPDQTMFQGIIPVLVASVLSGLASALCQWASQVRKHTSYLMTVEMSVMGSLCLLASTYKSPDGEAIRRHGFFYGWNAFTLIPVLSNAVGGILVGLVTTHAGGVRKASSTSYYLLNCLSN
ncbi:hypothetical protein GIB67_013949 [Kingdonia uniflora]|uniref:CMP-sialic acid transporter 5 n=1 Tax=Kingdonia uniflora TaxID=39325 RepID=A0A7J7LDB4_9MAGN|nr:hypothetical protein GIB67_013949 [Kingdonia uniflora]